MIQVGIIGMGQIGFAHLDALLRIPNVEVTAICGPELEVLKKYQKRYGIKHIFLDWRDLVRSNHVDAVHNCTPNDLHHTINLACLEQGKVIFSEKPLGMELAETMEAQQMAQESKVLAGVNFCYRGYPMVQWAKTLIRDGYLGEIRLIHGHYLQDWLMYESDFNWRVDSKIGGITRALGDIGSHWIDLAMYLTGLDVETTLADIGVMLPERVNPSTGEKVEVDTEDWAAAILQFSKNVRGTFMVSQINGGHKNDLEIEIVGSKRSLRWSQEDPEQLWVGERGGINFLHSKDLDSFPKEIANFISFPPGHPEGYSDCVKNTIANFYACVRAGAGDYPSFADGHRVMEVVTAIMESAKTERWVKCGR